MMDILGLVTDLAEDPYSRAREEKEKGRKIVGVTPMHFPEELVHASGALPIVLQASGEPVTAGYGHIYPFYCGFTRSTVDLAVRGKLDFLDAVVLSDVCLQTRHMSNIVRYNMPHTPFIYMQWPLEARSDRWLEVTLRRLRRCRKGLEEVVGAEITDAAIEESIKLYNQNRALLRRIYDIRRRKPGALRAREAVGLVLCSMLLPKEETNKLFAELLPELEARPASADGKVKVFLSGHLCQAVKGDILDLVEDLGMVVVGDDLYTGYRYPATDVPEGFPPLEALAQRYFDLAVPCPTRSEPSKEWGDYLVGAARESGTQGLISLVVKHCEAHMIYFPHLKGKLDEAGMRHLLIETEHEVVSLAGVRTRLQAFKETLE